MQKKLIALAVAGLVSGGAFAQSNVTVYGIVDTNVTHISSSAAATATSNLSRTNVDNSGLYTTRIGFKGTEDLGGGLKAAFAIESNLGTDAPGATTLGDRLMTIGLSGGWGSLNLGRQYTPYFNVLAAGDTWAYAGRGSANNVLGAASGASGVTVQGTVRQSNSIRYDSPSFSGFSAALLYSAGGEGTTTATANDGQGAGLSLRYANGPLSVGWAMDRVAPTGAHGGTGATETQSRRALTASFNFGMAEVVGGYATAKAGGSDQFANNAATMLGVRIPMGSGMVRVQWAQLNDKLATNTDSSFWSVGYAHSMSKRTTAYVNWGNFNDKNNLGTVADWRALQAGVAHTF